MNPSPLGRQARGKGLAQRETQVTGSSVLEDEVTHRARAHSTVRIRHEPRPGHSLWLIQTALGWPRGHSETGWVDREEGIAEGRRTIIDGPGRTVGVGMQELTTHSIRGNRTRCKVLRATASST